jgi:phosphate transport system permease protein
MSNPVRSEATIARVRRTLRRRYLRERMFHACGILSLCVALASLLLLFADIARKGLPALRSAEVSLEVHYDAARLGVGANPTATELGAADYDALLKDALRARFEGVGRAQMRELNRLLSSGAVITLQQRLMENPALLGTRETLWLPASGAVDTHLEEAAVIGESPEGGLGTRQLGWVRTLQEEGALRLGFNQSLFLNGDSRDPERAGIRGAVAGSLLTLLVTLVLSFPLGVAAAIYLEEFAGRNRWTDFIEVNINNLAAVPSIIFGLLGLAMFVNFFGMPRSAPLVGGLVLTLVTFPTVIIASRAAIRAVPPSLREAALGLGASRVQMVLHHVLPSALPGMLTGAIIGMARALGETAPLLMIGMVAFIVDVPGGVLDSATVLPVQIYLWADSPERGFTALTSAAILVLLVFLVLMNAIAVYLRARFEQRW